MTQVVKEKEMHTPGTANLSKAGARYVRSAKTAGGKVFAAIDSSYDGKNCTSLSCMVNFVGLAKEGNRELGIVLLAGYIACATTYSRSLEHALDGDLEEALNLVYDEAITEYRNEVEKNADLVRELTRRDANKPKE